MYGCGNSNPKVRDASIKMIASVYKYVGDPIRDFLKDVKDSTKAVIDDVLSKTERIKVVEPPKRQVLGEDGKPVASDAGASLLDSLPRVDVSKELSNSKLIEKLQNTNWKTKKEGYDRVEEVIADAKYRILPDGLSDLFGALKAGLVDKNKAVLKTCLQLIAKIAKALGPGAKMYNKKVMNPVLQIFADKDKLVRSCTVDAVESWKEAVGAETIINIIGAHIQPDNPEMRTCLLKFMIDNKEAIDKAELDPLVKPLIDCLTDKTPEIRKLAEEVIVEVMRPLSYDAFVKGIQDLKPAVKQTIKPILDQCKTRLGD